jgi:hypothetical protein
LGDGIGGHRSGLQKLTAGHFGVHKRERERLAHESGKKWLGKAI